MKMMMFSLFTTIGMSNNIKDKSKIYKILSGSTIKIIAMTSMLIDHIGASVLAKMIRANYYIAGLPYEQMKSIYTVFRYVGKLAFPIYIFLLIEGINHTRNEFKYLGRMIIFAFVSEIPFDLAFKLSREQVMAGILIDFSHQNIYFTLALGLAAIIMIRKIKEIFSDKDKDVVIMMQIFAVAFCMILAYIFKTDYGYYGVLAIVVGYILREFILVQNCGICTTLCAVSSKEIISFFCLIPILLYNGKRGINLKYFFYAFYPVHLIVLGGVWLALGL